MICIKVVQIPGKGRGVVTTKPFGRDEFIVEYRGKLVDANTMMEEERRASEQDLVPAMTYVYFFKIADKKYW